MMAVLLVGAASVAGCTSTGDIGGASLVGAFVEERAAQDQQPVATAIVDAMSGGLAIRTGSQLGQRDLRQALEAEYRTLEYTPAGQPVTWGKAGGARFGEVVAGAPYRVGSQNCRQYSHNITVSGRVATARGSACRNDDGSWMPLG